MRAAATVLRGMWRFRWLGAACAWAVGLIALAVVFTIPERYEATARIFVNTDSILKPLMTGLTVQPNDEQRIAMLGRVVISRPNVEKLVEMAKLDAEVKSSQERDRLVDGLMKTLEFKSAGRGNLYTLAYRNKSPERAREVIELLAAMFIESSKGNKESDTEAAKRFIEDQIKIYETKLQEAENRLKEFRLRYFGMTPGDGKDFFVRMTEARNQLNQARLELREAERSRDALRRGLASESTAAPSTGGQSSSYAIADLDARIEATRRNIDSLLQRYTPNHPDVQGARRTLAELEQQRHQALAARASDPAASAVTVTGGTRAAETLKVSLTQAEAQVASLSARVAEYSSRYETLKASAAMVPQLEAEYAQLNRDYDVNKKNYELLVSRRESAAISGEMQSVEGVGSFRLVDPPRVSPQPVAPNRTLLFPLALALALAAGVVAAYAAWALRPTFSDGRALREATGLPLLGLVSECVTDAQERDQRREKFRLAGIVAALMGVYVASFVAMRLA
ncbi:MAG: chain length-determining protein [Betaproteobacteria bacterium]|nr:chain length-determining protein [Betaproteobacteria bacterium]